MVGRTGVNWVSFRFIALAHCAYSRKKPWLRKSNKKIKQQAVIKSQPLIHFPFQCKRSQIHIPYWDVIKPWDGLISRPCAEEGTFNLQCVVKVWEDQMHNKTCPQNWFFYTSAQTAPLDSSISPTTLTIHIQYTQTTLSWIKTPTRYTMTAWIFIKSISPSSSPRNPQHTPTHGHSHQIHSPSHLDNSHHEQTNRLLQQWKGYQHQTIIIETTSYLTLLDVNRVRIVYKSTITMQSLEWW